MRTSYWIVMSVLLASASMACTSRGESSCRQDYGDCDLVRACGEGATCEEVAWDHGGGDICVRTCDDELDCPRSGGRGGRCIDVRRTGEFQCYQDCVSSDECPTGWVCQPIRSGGELSGICLP